MPSAPAPRGRRQERRGNDVESPSHRRIVQQRRCVQADGARCHGPASVRQCSDCLVEAQRGYRIDASRAPRGNQARDHRHDQQDERRDRRASVASRAVTPNSSDSSSDASSTAPTMPTAMPARHAPISCRSTSASTLDGLAPSAMRTPSSCVRCDNRIRGHAEHADRRHQQRQRREAHHQHHRQPLVADRPASMT